MSTIAKMQPRIETLPEWLQKLWIISPMLARQAEDDYMSMNSKLSKIQITEPHAWYCKVYVDDTEVFVIVTGETDTDAAIKIANKFGKATVYNFIDKYEIL